MITITVKREDGIYRSFRSEGHSGYADEGSDIICAAVSALSVNALNSIESLTGDTVKDEAREGYLYAEFPEGLSHDGQLLMDSLMLGLTQIAESYEEPFVKISIDDEYTGGVNHAEHESSAVRS